MEVTSSKRASVTLPTDEQILIEREFDAPKHLVYKDRKRDLALLTLDTDLPPLPVSEQYKFQSGQGITVIGNPGLANASLQTKQNQREVAGIRSRKNERARALSNDDGRASLTFSMLSAQEHRPSACAAPRMDNLLPIS